METVSDSDNNDLSSGINPFLPKILSQKTLSILIPVYNEEQYLETLINRVENAPVPAGLVKELILVNDCSKDRTPEIIKQLCGQYPNIRAFDQPFNQGKGAAIRRAVEEMTGDFAIIQDADLEYDPNEYPVMLKPLLEKNADVVYGSRFANREMRKVLFYHHKLGNLFLTFLSNLASGLDLTDMETCYKAFKGSVLKSIPLRSNRFGMEPEITLKIGRRDLNVYEVPISYHGRRYTEGKKIGWKDGVSAIWTIFKYRFLFNDSIKK
ncbi:glycosyl transferase [Planctomycetales bacterium]|nr:glycosyl transferase [Planctomycetales bacterium]GHT38814.1 glycosyl transferase [Planctomycetales bacterium]